MNPEYLEYEKRGEGSLISHPRVINDIIIPHTEIGELLNHSQIMNNKKVLERILKIIVKEQRFTIKTREYTLANKMYEYICPYLTTKTETKIYKILIKEFGKRWIETFDFIKNNGSIDAKLLLIKEMESVKNGR